MAVPHLDVSSSLLSPLTAVPLASLATYLVFKRYEPSSPLPATALLGLVPAALATVFWDRLTLTTTLAIFLSHWFLVFFFTIAYRLSPFHPLARYPGPLLCKVSKGWMAYFACKHMKTHIYMTELHQRYGDIVRIGPNELSISHEDVPSILGAKGLPRGPYYDTREHEAGVSLDGLRDPVLHVSRRRPWTRGMSVAAIKYYEELLKMTVGDILAAFKSREYQQIDISAWMTFFGFDFMGHMAFTHDYEMLKTGRDVHNLNHLVEMSMIDAAWISHIPWSYQYLKLIPGASKWWDEMKKHGEETVRERVGLGSNQRDLFHYLIDEDGHEPVKPSLELCAVDGTLAVIAGADTSATILSHIWYFFMKNPDCLARLRHELEEAFPDGTDSTQDFTKQGAMPYLNACINEALRLYPPVLVGLQRRVVPGTGGRMVGPHFIPEGTQVSICAYVIQRDPRHFSPLPNTFWPDRWLTQDKYVLPSGDIVPASEVVTNRDVFMPFSQGPMVCAGKAVALMEIRAVVCAILQNFEMEAVDKRSLDKWEDELCEIFVTKRGTLPVYLRPRA